MDGVTSKQFRMSFFVLPALNFEGAARDAQACFYDLSLRYS